MNLVEYEPKRHVGKTLYELQGKELDDGSIATVLVRSDAPIDIANEMAWMFVVDEDEVVQ